MSILCQDGSRSVPGSVPRWREVGVSLTEGQDVHCVPRRLGQVVHCVPGGSRGVPGSVPRWRVFGVFPPKVRGVFRGLGPGSPDLLRWQFSWDRGWVEESSTFLHADLDFAEGSPR